MYMIYRNDFRKSSYKHKQIYINENKKSVLKTVCCMPFCWFKWFSIGGCVFQFWNAAHGYHRRNQMRSC